MVTAREAAAPGTVVVTGLGLTTALGFGVAENWRALQAGESGIAVCDPGLFRTPPALPRRLGAPVAREALAARIREQVPRQVWNTSSETCHLWLVTALEALAAAGLYPAEAGSPGPPPERVGIYVGSGIGSPMLTEAEFANLYTAENPRHRDVSRMAVPKYMLSSFAGQLSILTGFRGASLAVSTACSSGATALHLAADALRLGRLDAAVAGGVDTAVAATVVKGFHNLGALSARADRGPHACRPFDRTRDGIVLGDGAACLVLERAEAAARRGARPLAVLRGGATLSEAHHLLSPRPDGEGMTTCMAGALAEAGLTPQAVGHVYAHGTGTTYNDRCEAQALARVLPHSPTVSATKAQLGHTMGAAGAIDAVLACHGLATGAPPVPLRCAELDPDCPVRAAAGGPPPAGAVLVNAFAFGGHNTTLAFTPAPA